MKKTLAIIILSILLVISIILIFLMRSCNSSIPPNTEKPTTKPASTLDFKEYEEYKDKSITIPGTTGLNFKSGQLNQKVDFYNPENNSCYFIISLYLSDNTLIYKSDYLSPGEHIKEITLYQELKRGLYSNCQMVYNCYTLDNKSELNSGKVKIEIDSQ